MNLENGMDVSKAVHLKGPVYWVGRAIPDDDFQCHAYLIVNGRQSVLFDPGSAITIETTLEKIKEIIPLNWLNYLICQHQDPDITSSIGELEKLVNRPDLKIVTHSRAIALLKHYQWKSEFYAIDKHDWKLDAGNDLHLDFVFTPYLHFPGAFCSYEPQTKIMFTSDLFGGFTEEFHLFAEDVRYFENIRFFHQHYMPANEILVHALDLISKYDMDLIAPQHGSILRKELIGPIIAELKNLECGYFLEPLYYQNIRLLIKKNEVLKEIIHAMAKYSLFSETITRVKTILRRIVPVKWILVYLWDAEGNVFFLSSAEPKGKRQLVNLPLAELKQNPLFNPLFETRRPQVSKVDTLPGLVEGPFSTVMVPLITETKLSGIGVVVSDPKTEHEKDDDFFLKLFLPIAYAAEREETVLELEKDRDRVYRIAISDPLTGLYNRHHLCVQGNQEVFRAQRYEHPLSVFLLDIDNFKLVNDNFGHETGDKVLKMVAEVLFRYTRRFDICVRYGGEEMVVILPHTSLEHAWAIAERIRVGIEESRLEDYPELGPVTASIGIAQWKDGESMESTISRADDMMYLAKTTGKNRVVGSGPS